MAPGRPGHTREVAASWFGGATLKLKSDFRCHNVRANTMRLLAVTPVVPMRQLCDEQLQHGDRHGLAAAAVGFRLARRVAKAIRQT